MKLIKNICDTVLLLIWGFIVSIITLFGIVYLSLSDLMDGFREGK